MKFACKSGKVYAKDYDVLAIPQFSSKQEDIHHKKEEGSQE
jgi:hypothetical protein